jgi:hypothetical protein
MEEIDYHNMIKLARLMRNLARTSGNHEVKLEAEELISSLKLRLESRLAFDAGYEAALAKTSG